MSIIDLITRVDSAQPLSHLPRSPEERRRLRVDNGVSVHTASAAIGSSALAYSQWEACQWTPRPENERKLRALYGAFADMLEDKVPA